MSSGESEINPRMDVAETIVDFYWSRGLSRKQAVKEGYEKHELFNLPFNLDEEWGAVWASTNVRQATANFHTEIQEMLPVRVPEYLDEMDRIAKSGDVKDHIRERALEFLIESGGVGPKKEIEVTHRNEFENKGVEGILEYIESLPLFCDQCGESIRVDRKEFIKGSF